MERSWFGTVRLMEIEIGVMVAIVLMALVVITARLARDPSESAVRWLAERARSAKLVAQRPADRRPEHGTAGSTSRRLEGTGSQPPSGWTACWAAEPQTETRAHWAIRRTRRARIRATRRLRLGRHRTVGARRVGRVAFGDVLHRILTVSMTYGTRAAAAARE